MDRPEWRPLGAAARRSNERGPARTPPATPPQQAGTLDNPLLNGYLAELRQQGQHDSSGAFTWDSSRFAELLTEFQLSDPYEYVLRALASAVAGKATWFQLRRLGAGVELAWDGFALTLDDLVALVPSLIDQAPRPFAQRELAVALVAARAIYSQVSLATPHGKLTLGERLVVKRWVHQGPTHTALELCSPGRRLMRWLRPKTRPGVAEAACFKSRGGLAPLELRGVKRDILRMPYRLDLLLAFGEPYLQLTRDFHVAAPAELGYGYAAMDGRIEQSSVTMVHCGVSYELDWKLPWPNTQIWWWTDRFPLDLSRMGLVDGMELNAWKTWLVSNMQTAFVHLLELYPDTSRFTSMLGMLLERECFPRLEEALLFRRANGTRVSLSALRQQARSHGFLPITREVWGGESEGWNADEVLLVDERGECALDQHFPNWIRVDHFKSKGKAPRLPSDQTYLTRMPLLGLPGEIGLRADGTASVFRILRSDGREEFGLRPAGVDLACSMQLKPNDLNESLLQLYRSLIFQEHEAALASVRSAHLLEFLCWVARDLPLTAAASRLERLEGVSIQQVDEVVVETNRGSRSLPELLKVAGPLLYCIGRREKATLESEVLFLDSYRTAESLEFLLAPTCSLVPSG